MTIVAMRGRCSGSLATYTGGRRARWISRVIASTADEAIEAAAVEFKTDAWKLIAVRQYEIA
jgi:hypothetical protein